MSTDDDSLLNKLLVALDKVREDYTCVVCSELCKKPVVLGACFHVICSSHFAELSHCPCCKLSLLDSTVHEDDHLEACVDSVRELVKMFGGFRRTGNVQDSKGHSSKIISKNRANDTTQRESPTSSGTSKKRKLTSETHSSNLNEKENKFVKTNLTHAVDKSDRKPIHRNITETLNTTVLPPSSYRLNKSTEKKNNKGETALHIACRQGKIDKVVELLKQGANPNSKDNAGWTPLHEVVQNGRLDLVQLLLQYNTLINVPGQSNETPLHEAIRYNHWMIAVELVKNGANVNTRNCKGETPMQLASEDLKEILRDAEENMIQTQSVNVTFMSEIHADSDFEDIRVYFVWTSNIIHNNTYVTVLNKLKVLAKNHSNLHIEHKLTKKVTHLIVNTNNDNICTSTLDILQGVVNSIWIISVNWIIDSTEERLESFEEYEVSGVGSKTYNGPRKSRYNKYKQLPGIFNGCHFYLHNFNVKYEITELLVLTKALLTKLIVDAGGVVLRRTPNPELIPESERLVPYHAQEGSKLFNCSHYIIYKDMYEPMYNMSHIKALPIGWLIECLESYELCEPW